MNQSSSTSSPPPPKIEVSKGMLLRDFMTLMKPNISLLVIITTIGGVWMAPGTLPFGILCATILGTLGVVIGANTLNCYLERETDKEMARTKNRPLPAGRMNPSLALSFGLSITVISTFALWYWVNLTTTLLSSIAFISYVWIYTPMKRLSPQALTVGSIPGAMPPLMGWTAVTGSIDWPGLALFGVLFFWQIPHFIAIAFYRQTEYEKAGLKTIPSQYGHTNALWQNIFWSLLLISTSLSLAPLGVAGVIYTTIATILGVILLGYCIKGFKTTQRNQWARKLFIYTLIYLTVLFGALVIDAGSIEPADQLPLPEFLPTFTAQGGHL